MSSTSNSGGAPVLGQGQSALDGIAHDLRHSLHVVRTGLQLLRDSRLDEQKFNELCAVMESEERKANVLLDELIALARTKA